MNYSFLKKFMVLAFLAAYSCSPSLAALDSKYNRNGEVYLSVSGVSNTKDGIWRLNNPEGQAGIIAPNRIINRTKIKSFSVNIERIIYSLCDPIENEIGSDYMLYRQVLDNTTALKPYTVNYSSGKVLSVSPDKYSFNMYEGLSDWGDWDYPHTDSRSSAFTGTYTTYRSKYGAGTLVYRTVTDPTYDINKGTTGTKVLRKMYKMRRGGSYHGMTLSNASLSTVYAKQGEYVGPNLPNGLTYSDVLPYFSDNKRYLPYYQGKNWYKIPNGAWYSTWRYFYGRGYSYQPAEPDDKMYGQTYCDLYVGATYDWNLTTDGFEGVSGANINNYKQTAAQRLVQTSKTSIIRGIICNCLDSCGVSTGPVAETEAYDVIFSAAFMPKTPSGVNVYTYQRLDDGKTSGSVSAAGCNVFGNVNGYGGKYDTRWIGASKGKTKDYVYLLGTSNIQHWIGSKLTIGNKGISGVSVSNQWSEKGGIIFALDPVKKLIIRFTLNDDQTLDEYVATDISDVMKQLHSDTAVSIDDVAADGWGNYFISFTEPSSNKNYNVPQEQKWSFDKASSCVVDSSGDAGITYKFTFNVTYSKSVWRMSANGQNPQRIGKVDIATRKYFRTVTVPTSENGKIVVQNSPRNDWQKTIDQLLKDKKISNSDISSFIAEAITIPVADSKIAVINSPTPPQVLSLGENKSWLDIIGPYDHVVAPNVISTGQDADRAPIPYEAGTLYYFYVENYPLEANTLDGKSRQDPNTNPDYDGDGRKGGFVSTVRDETIKYKWKIWNVSEFFAPEAGDANAGKLVPSFYSSEANSPDVYAESNDNTPYVSLYSPNKANYIVTCCATYSWINYESVEFGQTYSDWLKTWSSPTAWQKNNNKLPINWAWATPSTAPGDADTVKKRIKAKLEEMFVAKGGCVNVGAKLDKIADYIYNNSDPKGRDYMAIDSIMISGEVPPPPEGTGEEADIEKTVGKPTSTSQWYTASQMGPKAPNAIGEYTGSARDYFGVSTTKTTYLRIALDAQGMFYTDNLNTKTSDNQTTYYEVIKKKFLDPKSPFYVYSHEKAGKPETQTLKFDETGTDQIRWKNVGVNEEPALQSVKLTYYSIDDSGKNKVMQTRAYTAQQIDNKIITDSKGKKFLYIEIPAGAYPPTDPFEGDLTIEINREIEYNMWVVKQRGVDEDYLVSKPIVIRRPYTLTGKTKIMFIDTSSPTIVWSATKPQWQITGNAGSNIPTQIINATWEDNSPMEKMEPEVLAKGHHDHYHANNINTNKTLINSSDAKNSNLLPVFDRGSRGAKIVLTLPHRIGNANFSNVPANKKEYCVGYGKIEGQTYSGATLATVDMTEKGGTRGTLAVSTAALNNGGPIMLPYNYANNTPGYVPASFTIQVQDSSGNRTELRELNLCLEIVDSIPPVPFARVTKYKAGRVIETSKFPLYRATNLGNFDADTNSIGNIRQIVEVATATFRNNTMLPITVDTGNWASSMTQSGSLQAGQLTTNHMGYEYWALPYNGIMSSDQITSLSVDNYRSIRDSFIGNAARRIPPTIIFEDDVECYIEATGADNAGSTNVALEYYMFNLEGRQVKVESNGIVNTVGNSGTKDGWVRSRAMFRQNGNVPMPYAVPVKITVTDNAKNADKYTFLEDGAGGFRWSKKNGGNKPTTRTLKTIIPVIGTTATIRTLDKYTNTDRR